MDDNCTHGMLPAIGAIRFIAIPLTNASGRIAQNLGRGIYMLTWAYVKHRCNTTSISTSPPSLKIFFEEIGIERFLTFHIAPKRYLKGSHITEELTRTNNVQTNARYAGGRTYFGREKYTK